ncbi:hypothetical protein Tco_0618216 [Tanacetum coccineum]
MRQGCSWSNGPNQVVCLPLEDLVLPVCDTDRELSEGTTSGLVSVFFSMESVGDTLTDVGLVFLEIDVLSVRSPVLSVGQPGKKTFEGASGFQLLTSRKSVVFKPKRSRGGRGVKEKEGLLADNNEHKEALGTNHDTSIPKVVNETVKNHSLTSRGVFEYGLKIGFKPQKEYRSVPKKPTASSSGNKIKGVEPTIEVSNSNHITMGRFWHSKFAGTMRRILNGNGDYDDDPYDDDMYEGQDLSHDLQAICDNLDIRVRGLLQPFASLPETPVVSKIKAFELEA